MYAKGSKYLPHRQGKLTRLCDFDEISEIVRRHPGERVQTDPSALAATFGLSASTRAVTTLVGLVPLCKFPEFGHMLLEVEGPSGFVVE